MTAHAVSMTCSLVALTLLPACGEPGQQQVSMPLFVAGAALEQPIAAQGDVIVTLEQAELAFGPLYLCSGFQAGELCDTARLEWLDSTVVDLLSPAPRRAGSLSGSTGPVRSWMYDLGISSQLTRAEPFVLEAAAELGGASLVVSGRASRSGVTLAFTARVVVEQGGQVERGVPVIRKSGDDAFAHEIAAGEAGLWVRFDAEPWVGSIDFSSELDATACSDGEPCTVSQSLELGSPAYLGLHNALVLGERPTFSWRSP